MVHKDKNKTKKPITKKVAFGSGAQRFSTVTSHPKLDPSGVHHGSPEPGCDPARYNPQEIDKIFEVNKNIKTPQPWTRQANLEQWSKNLGYRNQKILAVRRWQRSLLGPAWHDTHVPVQYKPACDNLSFGRTARFKVSKVSYPPPGRYYNPHPYKVPYGPHSTRPTFEREPECRMKHIRNSNPAPNRYTIIDLNSIEMKPKKLVSIRGPYDLFTGLRNASTIISRNNTSKVVRAATWPIDLPSTLTTYDKSNFGKFNKTTMQKPYRGRNALVDLAMRITKAGEPGPGDYDILTPKSFKENKAPFNSSYDKPRGYVRAEVWPAVGRYNTKVKGCGIIGQGHRHVFLNNIPRTIGSILPQPMNSF